MRPGITYRNPFKEIRLASGKKIVVERATAMSEIDLAGPEVELFRTAFLENPAPLDMNAVYGKALSIDPSDALQKKWQKIIQAEALRSGLMEYY
jgi:hypothetical protein